MEKIRRYFAENSRIIIGGAIMLNGGSLYAAYRAMGR